MTSTLNTEMPAPVRALQFEPGALVSARGREWIVLQRVDDDTLRVRPVTGSEEDQLVMHLPLELEPVTAAVFAPPQAGQIGSHDSALLLRDALLLSLRRGAGPLRAFGHVGVEPRAYQLVPLLMALKQSPVRLLIADDVGVGKTIEAALIAREFLDRGLIARTTVLCPPHLVDQWVTELRERTNIQAVAVTATSARRLEAAFVGQSIFASYAHTVVSLDYIKSEARRAEFLRACPEFVIVDEAHTCAAGTGGRHQRFELLRDLVKDGESDAARHLVMLTATPHSGDDDAYFRLLSLLHPDFLKLQTAEGKAREALRTRLSNHLVQRRRQDIDEWKDGTLFPTRQNGELTYTLRGDADAFFQSVLAYCADIVVRAEGNARQQRLSFWGTLALMRCVASSPAAALQALRTRAGIAPDSDDSDELDASIREQVFDGSEDALVDDDAAPALGNDDPALVALLAGAEKLRDSSKAADDPKLAKLLTHVQELISQGFSPVVFCRYIATAHHVAARLRAALGGVVVDSITGELAADERVERVAILQRAEQRVLVATDCLSEGINLQSHFNAVVHYDLSWNPTRHEQREGRVDRFGQPAKVVRTTLMYGENNPVDGAVLEVIVRKGQRIREELGVAVPLPDEGHTLTQALLHAVLLKKGGQGDTGVVKQLALFDDRWQQVERRERQSRVTRFAQQRLQPAEVLPEWHKSLRALGSRDDVKRFTGRALARLGSGLMPRSSGHGFTAALDALPPEVRERLAVEGLEGTVAIDFDQPPAPGCRSVSRSHPLVGVLAQTLLGRSLMVDDGVGGGDPTVLGRVGAWNTAAVTVLTTVAVLRLRHQLTSRHGQKKQTTLVEEAFAVAFANGAVVAEGDDALALLTAPPVADVSTVARGRLINDALSMVAAKMEILSTLAQTRASTLLLDHQRVLEASKASGAHDVVAVTPPDIIGVSVLVPVSA